MARCREQPLAPSPEICYTVGRSGERSGSGKEVVRLALLGSSSGCKVGWHYWSTLEEARADSEKQRAEARRQAARGYDFGYCMPGEIQLVANESAVAHLNERFGTAATEIYCVTTP